MQEDTYDKDFIATHTVGFDIFKDYVLGKEDGIPKTPKWAEPICGVPSRTIKALARKWAKEATTIAHCNGGSYIRSTYSHEPARLEVACLAMQGLGKPGRNQFKFIEWGTYGLPSANPAPRPLGRTFIDKAFRGFHFHPLESFIPKTLVPKAILDYTEDNPLTGMATPGGMPRGSVYQYQYPVPGSKEIHMIWTDLLAGQLVGTAGTL